MATPQQPPTDPQRLLRGKRRRYYLFVPVVLAVIFAIDHWTFHETVSTATFHTTAAAVWLVVYDLAGEYFKKKQARARRAGASTRVSRVIRAKRSAVYRAFLDPNSVVRWLPPNNMTGEVHVWEPRAGGAFRISLTYQAAGGAAHPPGKTAVDTDTVQGRFVQLIRNELIVQAVTFDSPDPAFAGEMTIVATFTDAPAKTQTGAATEVTLQCENIPTGIRPTDNEQGARESLQKLAALLE